MENRQNNRHYPRAHHGENDDDDDDNNDFNEHEDDIDNINDNHDINVDNNNNNNHAVAGPPARHENPAVIQHAIDPAALVAASTCGKEPLPGLEVISIKKCQTSAYLLNPKAPERTGVVAVMLSLRTATGSGKTTLVNTGGARYGTGAGSNSRARLGNNYATANYDRIVTFADCSSTSGACFAYMTHYKTQSFNFFKNLRVGQEGIGDLILLEEINPVADSLGATTNVALIKGCSHVLPLAGDVATLVPSVPLEAPSKGDTRYFCQHQVRHIEFGHVSIEQAICGGKLWHGVK